MLLDKYLNLLETIDYWISVSRTGPAKDFARRLNISERRLHDYLAYMRDRGLPIEYSPLKKSYFYSNPGHLHIKIKFE